MTDFHGLPTALLENEHVRLEYLTTAGPRILGLSLRASPNLLADVHDLTSASPLGKYFFQGGHRLWTSPETPETTYIPDGDGLQVQASLAEVQLTWSGPLVRKHIRVSLDPQRAAVKLLHTLTNTSSRTLHLAPWAITMLRLGGTVILPQPSGNADPHGLLPNRLLSLWPYTRLHDPRLELRDDFILLHAAASLPPVKLGYLSTLGWMAYWLDGTLFRKSFDLHPGASYPDGGCNAETYCGDRFVELETLAPLVALAPGDSTTLTETWELYDRLDVPFIPPELRKLLERH